MLLLVTLVLVVASAILLVLGFVQSTLGFIYLSMLCAGVAALALIVFARLARRRSVALAGAGAQVGRPGPVAGDGPRRDTVSPAPELEPPDDPGPAAEEVVFPIENYDRLRVPEILPLLSRLGSDQLLEVRDRELAGKGRSTVLDRIDDLTGVPRTSRHRVAKKAATPAQPASSAKGEEPGAGGPD